MRRSGTAIERLRGQELPGDRALHLLHLVGGPLRDDVAAVLAGPGPHVDEPVGRAHHLLVVLDDQHGVAEGLQALERPDQLRVVALVQPDRRLVEDVEDADELRADLRREPQALCLAARERCRRAVELQVADADVGEEREPLPDLLDDAVPDQLLGLRELEAVEELDRPRDRHLRELVDVAAADGDGEHLGLETSALADRARPEAHVLLDALALAGRVGLLVAALEARDDALEREHVRASPSHAVSVCDVHLVAARAVEEEVLLLLGELAPRLVDVDLVAVCDRLDNRLVVRGVADRPGHERALGDRELRIGHEEVGVDLLLGAEPGAAGAGAVRRVEAEDARLQLGKADTVLGAGETLGERELLPVHDGDGHEALGERQGGLDRIGQTVAEIGLHRKPVDHDLDRVLELLVELDLFLEQPLLAVHLHAREALAPQLLEEILVLALTVSHDRRVDRELRAFREPQHLVDDGLDALPGDRPPADRAVRPPDARVQQAQVVVDLGDSAHGRARVPRGRLLVDRDRRREPVDRVDVRFLHHLQELARVRRERLDVAALPLGIDRVEGERGLPRAREARHADQRVSGQADGDVLEVVLAGAVYDELVCRCHYPQCSPGVRTNTCSLSRVLSATERSWPRAGSAPPGRPRRSGRRPRRCPSRALPGARRATT